MHKRNESFNKTHLAFSTYFLFGIRNLRRNSRRTLLTILALAVAMGSLTYLFAFLNAYMTSMKENFVLSMNGHVQIYAQNFKETNLIDDYIKNPTEIIEFLNQNPNVEGWTGRISTSGLASVARSTTSVAIIGIDPVQETNVTFLKDFVIEGEWLNSSVRGVILGNNVAKNLEVEIGDKVVFTTQGPGGDIVSEAFRVRGIIQSGIPDIDRMFSLIDLKSVQDWLGIGDGITELIIRTESFESVNLVTNNLSEEFDHSYDVWPWYEQNPIIQQLIAMQDAFRFILVGIVVILVLGQLINTMFMSLHDRVREFGLMESLGSQRMNLFSMLIWESVILVSIGGTFGYLIAYLIMTISSGIDLTAFGDTLGSLYIDSVVRPFIDLESTIFIFSTIFITAILTGLIPAWRATRLNPIEALRRI